MNSKLIYIIIPVHNRKKFTYDCLQALRKQTNDHFKVVVIDDGSQDGTGEMLTSEFPEVAVLKGNGDLWWAASTNLGVKYALAHGADYIMTLNNDTIPFPDFMEKTSRWAGKKKHALMGALAISSETGVPLFAGGDLNWKSGKATHVLDRLKNQTLKGIEPVNYFPGRGLLIPAEVFRRIGFFDEKRLPQTLADYDFTHRAVKEGFEIYCNLDAKIKIFPDESGDSEIRTRKSLKNYYLHLFSIKGGGNIVFFIKYAIKNCPLKYLPFFLMNGLCRRIGGYILEWIKEWRRGRDEGKKEK